jgi:hypothetical protein
LYILKNYEVVLLFNLIVSIVILFQASSPKKWVTFSTDRYYYYSYDSLQVKEVRENIFRVTIKDQANPDSLRQIRATMTQVYNSTSDHTTGYGRYSYTLSEAELDCLGEQIRYISKIDYMQDGKAIGTISPFFKDNKWHAIAPLSEEERLMEKICK